MMRPEGRLIMTLWSRLLRRLRGGSGDAAPAGAALNEPWEGSVDPHDLAEEALYEALLGRTPPALRAVTCRLRADDCFMVRLIFDGPRDEARGRVVEAIRRELKLLLFEADLGDVSVELEVLRVDHPGPLRPHRLREWAYRRRGEV
jgi:hypothetical protein